MGGTSKSMESIREARVCFCGDWLGIGDDDCSSNIEFIKRPLEQCIESAILLYFTQLVISYSKTKIPEIYIISRYE